MNYLSICAICRNEGRYLDEWISYHVGLGVEHFYLFNNDSTDDTWDIMESYPRVTRYNLPGQSKQFDACHHCIDVHRHDTRWLAFIDVDEFITPLYTKDLQAFLKPYEPFAGLCIHWRLFGSNGHKEYDAYPVVERFTRRQADVNPHVKQLCNPKQALRMHTVHRVVHSEGVSVDETFTPIAPMNPYPEGGTCSLIQINHYVTKSEEECRTRRSTPRADTGELHAPHEVFFPHHDRNEIEDLRALSIWRGWEELK